MKRLMLLASALLSAIFLFSGCGSAAQLAQQAPALVFPTSTGGAGQTAGSGAKAGTTLLTYRGHTDWVTALAWSPDGKEIASGSNDATVQIWDASTGTQIVKFSRHTQVTSLAWSPNGKFLVVGGTDTLAPIYDTSSGQPVLYLQGDTSNVNAVAWSPDGTRIATASSDRTVVIWDANSYQEVATFQAPAQLRAVAWSSDSKRIATGGNDGLVYVLDAATGKVLFASGNRGVILAIAWSPDGTRIASGAETAVQIWDANTGSPIQTYHGHTGTIYGIACAGWGAHRFGQQRVWRRNRPQPGPGVECRDRRAHRQLSGAWQ